MGALRNFYVLFDKALLFSLLIVIKLLFSHRKIMGGYSNISKVKHLFPQNVILEKHFKSFCLPI